MSQPDALKMIRTRRAEAPERRLLHSGPSPQRGRKGVWRRDVQQEEPRARHRQRRFLRKTGRLASCLTCKEVKSYYKRGRVSLSKTRIRHGEKDRPHSETLAFPATDGLNDILRRTAWRFGRPLDLQSKRNRRG